MFVSLSLFVSRSRVVLLFIYRLSSFAHVVDLHNVVFNAVAGDAPDQSNRKRVDNEPPVDLDWRFLMTSHELNPSRSPVRTEIFHMDQVFIF
jgi:hypothetical protein